MTKLARLAARFGAPYPMFRIRDYAPRRCLAFCVLLFAALVLAQLAPAFADTAQAPVADGITGGLISLWGPLLGVVTAFVIFFDRLAKVIPNNTTSSILNAVRLVATVLGAKVQDKQ
jgi:hypothetical protein